MTADSSYFIYNSDIYYLLLEFCCNNTIYTLTTTADSGSAIADGICFVVKCDWSTRNLPLSNSRQTSVRRSHSKILSSLPPSQGILAVVLIEELSAAITTVKMGKMQLLGAVAVILAFYSAHAKVYFREEFLDGGKFSYRFC